MPSKQFLKQVTSYIRSKEARSYVEEELQYHLAQSKQAWTAKGYSANEAEEKAIAEMGSASQLGKSMDKIHKPKWDFWLIGAVILLLIASFIPIITTDFGQGMTSYFVQRKLLHIILATIIIVAIMYFDYQLFQRFSIYVYSLALLLLVVILSMPNYALHGEAMVQLGPIRLQAWTVLPLLLIALAAFFSEQKMKGWQLAILTVIPLYFFFWLPNLPVLVLYIAVVAVLFFYSYMNRKQKLVVFSVAGGLSLVGAAFSVYAYHHILAAYQTERIAAFIQPERYADSAGFLILRLKEALAGAGMFGAEEILNIPAAHTDYALVQIIQSYGYGVGIAIILVILAIALRILWIVRTMPRSFGKLLIIAAVALYSVQCLYSILMVFGYLPIISIPLPFISYGMTPLFLNAILIGLVLSVYRRKGFMSTKLASN